MKLRLRSLETKETLRLEVPNPCTLNQLKQTLSQSISAAPSSSLRLSLNRRDELLASSPDASLASLGITSGDLIFYSFDASSPIPHTSFPPNPQTLISDGADQMIDAKTLIGEGSVSTSDAVAEDRRFDSGMETLNGEGASGAETLVGEGSSGMEIDEEGSSGVVRKKYSVPFFLRRVMREELPEERSDHKLLVIALHAVLSESRFVRFDSVSGVQTDRCCLPEEWPAVAYTLSLSYTLPEILKNRSNGGGGVEAVVLKVQTLGRFVNVYGSLVGGGGGSGPYRLSLDVEKFGPMLDFVWESRNVSDSEVFVPEIEIFEFWRIVKDGLTYPLLIDLCGKAGLPEPPSFMCLPLDLKMNILERLSGADVVKAGCACKELQNLANNDELWKQKFLEEFGSGAGGIGNWKFRFAGKWEERERQKKAVVMWRDHNRPGYILPMRRDPVPFAPGFPGIIRDPPGFGVPDPFGRPRLPYPFGSGQPPIFRHGRRNNFSPNCNLGGGGFSG